MRISKALQRDTLVAVNRCAISLGRLSWEGIDHNTREGLHQPTVFYFGFLGAPICPLRRHVAVLHHSRQCENLQRRRVRLGQDLWLVGGFLKYWRLIPWSMAWRHSLICGGRLGTLINRNR